MKTLHHNTVSTTKCAFGASLSPINRANCITFGLLDRICCLGVLAMVMLLMRVFIAK